MKLNIIFKFYNKNNQIKKIKVFLRLSTDCYTFKLEQRRLQIVKFYLTYWKDDMSAAQRYAAFSSSPKSQGNIIKQRQIAVSRSVIIYYTSFTITLDSCQSDNSCERICAVVFISAFVFASFDQNKHLRYGRFGALKLLVPNYGYM